MWVRKNIDIRRRDLAWGALQCTFPTDPRLALQRIHRVWGSEETLTCLSVRSGFDLFLQSTNWPPGSQIIMSGLNIPDMQRIVEHHGLVPVGVDLDPLTLAPSVEAIERAITPHTKALLIAHLFGGLVDLDPYFELARQHQLLLIEDCAQSYVGNHDLGDPRADLSMFSFGPIKTNTALAGAVLRVRREEILARMLALQTSWRMQSRSAFLKRILKYAAIKGISSRIGMSLLARSFRLRGKDHDEFISQAARGFPGPHFFTKIRHQPSLPLLRLLASKLENFNAATMVDRQQRAVRFFKRLQELASQAEVNTNVEFLSPGSQMDRQTYWVLALLVDEPRVLARQLWQAGFDATSRSSLEIVGKECLPHCRFILDHILFLPFDSRMPDSELERMAKIIVQSGARSPKWLQPAFLKG